MATEVEQALELFCRPLVEIDGVRLSEFFDQRGDAIYELREDVRLPPVFVDPKRARFMNLLVLKYARQAARFVNISRQGAVEVDMASFEHSLALSVCKHARRARINAQHLSSALDGPHGSQILLAWILATKKWPQFDDSSLVQRVMTDVIETGLSVERLKMPC